MQQILPSQVTPQATKLQVTPQGTTRCYMFPSNHKNVASKVSTLYRRQGN